MIAISVLLCTHNPAVGRLLRVLEGLQKQTLARNRWELVVVDNASREPVADAVALTWHEHGRHVREETMGLTEARLRGIAASSGGLLVFVDDDNVLAPDYLEQALAIQSACPHLGAFGAGHLEPEFEVEPPVEIRAYLKLLALRSVLQARWSNHPADHDSIPWGAGLCVTRSVAERFARLVKRLGITLVLGRRGTTLLAGEDDLFSWAAASNDRGFGIFPELRVVHLIPAARLTHGYMLRLIEGHALSHGVLHYLLEGLRPRPVTWSRYARTIVHGLRRGAFSMRCQWAAARGDARASRYIEDERMAPLEPDWSQRESRHLRGATGLAS